MKTKYNDFLKIYEDNNYIISLFGVENVIKNVFDEAKVSSVSTLYEKEEGINKLIITINNLFHEETNIIHTKIVFYVDDKKKKLTENFLHYHYDINCNFKKVKFSDLFELEEKLNSIIEERKFGKDLKILSDLSVTLASDVNEMLSDNDIVDISIYTITYTPIVDSVPCDSLTFQFNINIDDTRDIKMVIRKIEDSEYKITFNENDWFKDVTINSLRVIPQTITEMIKNYII